MIFLLGLLAIGLFAMGKPPKARMAPQTNWPRLPSGLMTAGHHYFFAVPWGPNYDGAHVKVVMGTMFDSLIVWGPATGPQPAKIGIPQPMPADWQIMQSQGYAIGTGTYIATQNGSGPITMSALTPLGADNTRQPIVWESTEDYVSKTMSGNTK